MCVLVDCARRATGRMIVRLGQGSRVRAIRIHEYGGVERMRLEDVPPPACGPRDLLVRVVAAGVDPIDWKLRAGAMIPPDSPLPEPRAMHRFLIEDTAVVLIDHQVGTNTWASTTPLALLQRNVLILARFAAGTGMPLVLTSSQETNVHVQGPLMPELREVAPDAFEARVRRSGVVNAWDDPAFAQACRAPGRRNLVMAGVTTDVCMVPPAISALEEGFQVQVVCDACGSSNPIAEHMAWRRMERAGVRLTSTNAIVAELVCNWASPAGAVAFPLLTA